MRISISTWRSNWWPRALLAIAPVILLAVTPAEAISQDDAPASEKAYRVILYVAERATAREVEVRRLREVWSEAEGAEKLQALLETGAVRQLDDVTVVPGREAPTIRLGEVTMRIRGALREPRRDRVFLRVEIDGGREALVKEMISRFDETIVLAYPLTEGERSIVALILPAVTE